MIFKSLSCRYGIYNERKFNFSVSHTLIYSENNSSGKSTLLRLLLYAIGYQIPSTKGLCFKEISTILEYERDGNNYIVKRPVSPHGDILILIDSDNQEKRFILPLDQLKLHKLLFGISNEDVLLNLLGCFYVDQEKGWTLLNRGTVIGKNKFSIEAFVRGLADRECHQYLNQLRKIEEDLSRYKLFEKVLHYSEELADRDDSIFALPSDEKKSNIVVQLKTQRALLQNELETVESIYKDNISVKRLIESLKISIQDNSGNIIPVTVNNIYGLEDSINFSTSRYLFLNKKIEELEHQIASMDEPKSEQLIDSDENLISKYVRQFSSLQLNSIEVLDAIRYLAKEKKTLNELIRDITRKHNTCIHDLYADIIYFCNKMELRFPLKNSDSFLFTNDLKSYSGAEFYKLVIAFKLSYIRAVRRK